MKRDRERSSVRLVKDFEQGHAPLRCKREVDPNCAE
jgi:hypothetical protein